MSDQVNLGAILKDYEENQELTLLDAGPYVLQFASFSGNRKTDVMPVYKVADGPLVGKRVMAGTFGSLAGAGGVMAIEQWTKAGVTKEYLAGLPQHDMKAFLKGVEAALKDVIISCTLIIKPTPAGEPRNNIVISTIKVVSRPALPDPATAAQPGTAVPTAAAAAVPTAAAAALPTATAPAPEPAAAPAPSAASADDEAAQFAAFKAAQAAAAAAAVPAATVPAATAPPAAPPAVAAITPPAAAPGGAPAPAIPGAVTVVDEPDF